MKITRLNIERRRSYTSTSQLLMLGCSPQCPRCGSMSEITGSHLVDEERIRVQQRRCRACHHTFQLNFPEDSN
ncbi:hypothetical protein KOR42_06020 [Thalassoglobus neptunius]|uniref:Uncharacterized protein n=1 Tax=Thalassoglobus neptunius TaxID=1938619 RepID=A0A5C5X288_9PLAN|nr:hypothetical protein KOR42_06020 [Thalassoglobus neptunius]